MTKQVLTNFAIFVDGQGYAGKAKEFEQPELAVKTLEYLAGGMAAPMDVPTGILEKLAAAFTLLSYDVAVTKHFGILPGKVIPVTARGAVTGDDGEVRPTVATMRGQVIKVEPGTWKPGEENTIKVSLALHYYKLEQSNEVLFEADIENMVLNVGGTDQLAAVRAALGI